MASHDDRGTHRRQTTNPSTGSRPAGKRFRDPSAPAPTRTVSSRGSHRASRSAYTSGSASRPVGAQPVTRRSAPAQVKKTSPVPAILMGILAIAVIIAIGVFAVPAVSGLLSGGSSSESVQSGIEVQINIPEGSSGDTIAQILSQNHVIDNPKAYYAAVKNLDAEMSIKPGDYILYTGQDPEEVVQQLVDGPNVEGITLTIQEGLTVAQTAARVEEVFGISADDFLAQAVASNYVADYPFLEGAYDDSLEGYLYPKTYSFTDTPTSDEIVRTLLDQFVTETSSLDLDAGHDGLNAQEIITVASLIERETAVVDERPLVASVIYNRLDIDMPLQIDAAIVYARGGGSDPVTYDDLEIDSPYNIYQNYGLTPGPICSPSITSIEAALNPADTDYLYYVASPEGDGTHRFSSDYEQFERDSQEYSESHQ